MDGKSAIVTGASRGVGAAIAYHLSSLGVNVVLFARSEKDLVDVARHIQKRGGRALMVVGDVCQLDDLKRVVGVTLERFDSIDILVNNAGALHPIGPVARADPEAWEMNWMINVLGPVMLTRIGLPHLREREGRIINVSSGLAVRPMPGLAAYCAAKAALNQFTKTLAEEEKTITTLAVRPGLVNTALQETMREQGASYLPKNEIDNLFRLHEQGELLSPDLPGRAIATLALYAPHEWSGHFISWDDGDVQQLVKQFLP